MLLYPLLSSFPSLKTNFKEIGKNGCIKDSLEFLENKIRNYYGEKINSCLFRCDEDTDKGIDENNKKPNIKPLMTYKGGRGNMVISNRTANSKRDINKTNIYSEYRENDIENDKNIINTSSKRTENNTGLNFNIDL